MPPIAEGRGHLERSVHGVPVQVVAPGQRGPLEVERVAFAGVPPADLKQSVYQTREVQISPDRERYFERAAAGVSLALG